MVNDRKFSPVNMNTRLLTKSTTEKTKKKPLKTDNLTNLNRKNTHKEKLIYGKLDMNQSLNTNL